MNRFSKSGPTTNQPTVRLAYNAQVWSNTGEQIIELRKIAFLNGPAPGGNEHSVK
jgi:hypothetical protein